MEVLSPRLGLALATVLTAGCGETTISIDDVTGGPAPSVDMQAGLLLYLRLEETEAGAQAVDASGNGHHGAPSADPPLPSSEVPPTTAANARCLSFNGAGQLVDLGNPPDLDVSGDVTLAAWVRPLAVDGYRNIVAHGFRWGPNGDLSLRIHDGDYEFTAWDAVDHLVGATVPAGDIDGWHHVVGVFERGIYRLYRDGELLAEQADAFVPIQVDAPWAVGGRSATTPPEDRYFDGFIDEVRVYGRALSAVETRALFAW